MATQSHGFYGLGGSTISADFGLAASMTLPMITKVDGGEHDPDTSATMPTENKGKRRNKTKFAVESDPPQELAQQEIIQSPVSKKPSWKSRLGGIFRRNSKYEKRAEAGEVNPATHEGPGYTLETSNAVPSRTVDDLEVDRRKARKMRKREKKSRSTAFDESTSAGYLPSQAMQEGSSDFLKLALKPKGAGSDFEAIKVTLRRKSDGFGIHLSGGLPPISVTYVQPGSEAESARIMVGDVVSEVNGHNCLKGVGISRVMELKSLIQQSSMEAEQEHVDDGAWEKIKEKQGELESDNSEDGEITRIDESSDSEEEQKQAPKEEPPKPAVVVGPKSSTPKKTPKKKKSDTDLSPVTETSQVETPTTSPIKDITLSPSDSPSLVTVGVIKKTKRKKKQVSSNETNTTKTSGDLTVDTSKSVYSSSHKLETSAVESPAQVSPLKDEPLSPDTKVSQTKVTPKKAKKKKKKSSKEEPRPRSELYRAETIQLAESPDGATNSPEEPASESMQDTPRKTDKDIAGDKRKGGKSKSKPKKKKTKNRAEAPESPRDLEHKKPLTPSNSGSKIKSSFEESNDLEWVDSGDIESPDNTRSERNVQRRKSVDVAHVSNDDLDHDLLVPITSDKRSTSYHDLDKEDRKMFREELRQASKSEYDINDRARGATGPKVEIDPNVRVKKSGVVIGKRKTNERPSIFEADGGDVEGQEVASAEEKPKKQKGKRKHKRKLVMDMDITAVPKTSPSLGLKHGHERIDIINRSLSKRRPASLRRTLLLDSKKEVLMGRERVDLSEPGDGKLLRQQSVSDKSEEPPTPEPPETTPKEPDNIDQPVTRPRRQSMAEYMESLQRTKYTSLTRPLPSTQTAVEEQPTTLSESYVSPSAARKVFEQNESPKKEKKTVTPSKTVMEEKAASQPQPEASKGTTDQLEMPLEQPTSGGRRSKTVDQPVKRLGIASEPEKPASPVKSNTPRKTPEWVSIAQNKQNRTSVMYGDEKPPAMPQSPTTNTTPSKPVPTTPTTSAPDNKPLPTKQHGSKDEFIPKMGTVRDRLAMFQKNK